MLRSFEKHKKPLVIAGLILLCIAGLTAIGRATAEHLRMNSPKAVEARTLWFAFFARWTR